MTLLLLSHSQWNVSDPKIMLTKKSLWCVIWFYDNSALLGTNPHRIATLESLTIARKWWGMCPGGDIVKILCNIYHYVWKCEFPIISRMSVSASKLGMEFEYAKFNLKTSILQTWVNCHLHPICGVKKINNYFGITLNEWLLSFLLSRVSWMRPSWQVILYMKFPYCVNWYQLSYHHFEYLSACSICASHIEFQFQCQLRPVQSVEQWKLIACVAKKVVDASQLILDQDQNYHIHGYGHSCLSRACAWGTYLQHKEPCLTPFSSICKLKVVFVYLVS